MPRPRSPVLRQIRRRLLIAAGLLAAFAALFVAMCNQEPSRDDVVTVFAAASLTDVLRAVEAEFEAAYHGVDLVVNVGATSMLARQIEVGAPADVFFSASPEWTDYLAAKGLLRYPARPVFGNTLVVIGRAGETERLGGPDGLLRFDRIAVADPGGVPAGQYAKRALERVGLWDAVASRLVPMTDVRATVASVQTGAVPVAIVYASDALLASDVQVLLPWPEASQPRIWYTIAVPQATQHPNRALEFVEFVLQPQRLGLWRQYGFEPLAEPVRP